MDVGLTVWLVLFLHLSLGIEFWRLPLLYHLILCFQLTTLVSGILFQSLKGNFPLLHFLSKSFCLFCVIDAVLFPVVTGFKDISFSGSSVSFSLVNVASPSCGFLSILALLDLPVLSGPK